MRQFIQKYRALFLSLFLLLNGSIDAFSQNVLDRAGLPVSSSLAYSLRKLSNSYTGYAVQVRRSSDNALANVSFDANGVVSANSTIDGTTNTFQSFFGSSSCFVQTWYDQSGNNRHASQSNTAKQPMIISAGVLNVLNNKAALNFNGTSNVMNIPMAASVINTTGAISTVLKTAQLQQQFEALLSWSSGTSPYGPGFGPQNSIATGKFGLYTTWGPFNLSLGPVTANTDYVLNASWTGQSVTQSRNGNISTGNMGAAFTTNVSSGYMGQDNPNSGYFAGTVPEIIVFSTELGTTNRAALESNQNQFYFPPIIPATGLHFDGINDYVRVTDNANLDFGSQDFTVEAWTIKYANTIGFENSGIVGKWNTGSSPGTNEWLLNNTSNGNDNKASFLIESGNTIYQVSGTTNLVLGNWYHLAAVKKGTSLTLYVNGIAEGTINIPIVAVNNIGRDMLMGAYRLVSGVPNLFSKIALDEVRIWKRALCADELQANQSGELSSPLNLLSAYYKLNAGSIGINNAGVTNAVDASGNNSNGTLNGFALNGTISNWVAGIVTGTNPIFTPPSTIITGVSLMNVGETAQLTANNSGSWSSSNSSIASINSNGLVTAINNGSVNILFINSCGVTSTKTITINRVVAGPAGINNGIAMWLDAADIDADGIAGNNPTVNTSLTIWKDKSGYTRNATSLNTLNPITYIPNQINGNPVARFTRVNDVVGSAMQVANMDIRSVTNPEVTMFTVYKTGAKGSNGQGQALWGNDNGAWDRFFYNSWNFSDDGIVSLGLGNPNFANITGAGITGKTQLMTAVYKSGMSGGSAIYFNGAVVTNFTDNTDPSAALSSLRIGSDGDNGMFNGDIAEFIVYNRKLTNCEILQVNQYLGAKYGVTFTTATITAPATTVCSGTSAALTASAGDSYQWFKDGVSIASATAQTYNATATGSYTVAITTSGCTATSTATVISVTPAPVVTVTASGPTAICGGSPLVLTASTPNGGFWSTGEFGSSITVYGAGSYTVQVNSEDGLCSTTSEPLVVTENPTPDIADIINDGRRDICANTTMILSNDTPGGVWSSGNTAVATVDANGTVRGISEGNAIITYTVTNASGCSNFVTYEVIIVPIPVSGPLDGPTTICLNTPTTLNLTVNNGRDDRAEWTTSNANIVAITGSYPSGVNIAGLSAGTATVNYYFTLNGCRALVSTAQITVNPAPIAPTGVNQLRCSNGTVTFNTTVAEGEQINWYDAAIGGNLLFTGNAFTTPSLTATTTYYAEAFNTTSGCTSATRTAFTATIGTLPVVANITGLNTVCETGVIQLSNITTGGVWSSDNTALATVDATGKITGVQAGTVVIAYTVTNATGCSTTKTYTVTIKLKPAKPVIIGETSGCLGTTLTLTATSDAPNPSFRWCNTPTANPVRTFLLEYSTSLCVNVTSNGCSSDQIIVPVTAKPLPAAAITAVGSTSFCAGSSVQLNASAATGNTYQWKLNGNDINGATASNYIASATGNYTVAVTGANACTASSLAIAVNATDNVAPGSTAIQFAAPAAILNNVTEAAQYNLAYELNIPEYGNYGVVNPTYTVNNAAQLQNIPLDRIAYYMQLNNKWVWVSMDAFTNNVNLTGIPVTNTVWQQKVNNMNVFSSANAGVTNGTGITTGNIEMWKFNYAPAASLGLPAASSTTYDFDDSPAGNGNHGSFQVHNYGIGQTIFAYNRFGQTNRGEIGIGNNTTANGGNGVHPDWTGSANAHIYSTKKIYVFVKPKAQVLAKDATIYLDANGQATLPISAVSNNVQDNCSAVTSVVAPSVFNGSNIGTNTITLTLTDASGNSNSGTAVVTVKDIIAPVINCTASLNVIASSAAGTIVNYDLPVATDNAGNAVLQLVTGLASGSTFPLGLTTVSYLAKDASGNEAQCSFTVTVTGIPPSIMVPSTITVNAPANACGVAVEFAATETTAIPASTITYSHASGSVFPVGTTTVTATATNAVGTSTSTFEVTVKDVTAPIIGATTNINAIATSANGAVVTYDLPTATDNCGGVVSVVATPASGSLFPIGTTTVTVVATDQYNNSSSTTFTVTVVGLPPVIVVPATIRVDAAASNCGAVVNFAATETTAIPASTITYSHQPGSTFPLGTTTVTATATNAVGISVGTFEIIVTDNTAPVINLPAAPVFCENTAGTYTAPVVSATDNCGVATVSYAITGVTQRTGTGFDAGTAFNVGASTITYTVTDVNGNVTVKSIVVTVNKAPTTTIAASNPDAFCNKLVLVSNSTSAISSYAWSFNNASFASTQAVSLDNTNGDGTYSLYVTDNKGCTSLTAVSYQYSKQNTISNYTILAYKEAELKEYNTVQTGSVGVMSKKGKAEIGKNSSVAAPGAFVKAPKIEVKQGANVPVRLIGVATVSLPTMQYNTSNTSNLPNYTTNQGATISLSGNYKNLKIRKGSNVTLSGNTYGNIDIEEGSVVRFTSTVINVEHLKVGKGPDNGLTQVRFANNTSIRVAKHVQIEEDCFINPDGNKVTFYLGRQSNHDCNKHRDSHDNDDDDDDDHDRGHGDGDQKFEVKGGNTTVIANVYAPTGDIKVKGGEGCHKNHTSTVVKMTGLFIGYEVEGDGRNVIWNSYACGTAAPVIATDLQPVYNKTAEEVVVADDLKVTVMPNPSTTYFTLKLVSKSELPVNIKVVDAAGRLVEGKAKQAANSTLQLGHNYATGSYFAEFIQGNQRKVVQLIKIK